MIHKIPIKLCLNICDMKIYKENMPKTYYVSYYKSK